MSLLFLSYTNILFVFFPLSEPQKEGAACDSEANNFLFNVTKTNFFSLAVCSGFLPNSLN